MGFMDQAMNTILGSDSQGHLSSGLGEMLRGLKLSYDELCKIAHFVSPPTTQKVRSGSTTGTAGKYDVKDQLQLAMRAVRIDVTLFDNNAFIQWGKRTSELNDEMEYIAPGFYSLPAAAEFVQIRAVSGGTAARYAVSTWS